MAAGGQCGRHGVIAGHYDGLEVPLHVSMGGQENLVRKRYLVTVMSGWGRKDQSLLVSSLPSAPSTYQPLDCFNYFYLLVRSRPFELA